MVWYILAAFLLGVLLALIGVLRLRVGVLKVYIPDQPDEPPYLYTELDKPVGALCKKKYILFKVDVRHLESQI